MGLIYLTILLIIFPISMKSLLTYLVHLRIEPESVHVWRLFRDEWLPGTKHEERKLPAGRLLPPPTDAGLTAKELQELVPGHGHESGSAGQTQ